MKRFVIVCVLVAWSSRLHAQEPVDALPDVASYLTAAFNPSMALVKALRSEDPKCHVLQLLLAEALGNGTGRLMKWLIVSPRPCVGCDSRGFPSGHSINAAIGASWSIKWGASAAAATGAMRVDAHRHTKKQVSWGLTIGGLSELAGQKLIHCRD